MARVIDFNLHRRLTMTVIMKDESKSTLHLCAPTKSLVDRIQITLPELQKALSSEDVRASRAVYDLAAELINCNFDGIQVTREDLATKYEMNLEDMLIFYEGYISFLNEVKSEKN